MEHETIWLQQRVTELEASVQQARWHLNEIEEYRAELAPVWNDQCAAEMAQRYLSPCAAEAASALDALRCQLNELQASARSLEEGGRAAEQVGQFAQEIRRLDVELNTILHGLDSIVREVATHNREADAQVNTSRRLLDEAEAMGRPV